MSFQKCRFITSVCVPRGNDENSKKKKKRKKNAQLCFFAETKGSRARLATFVNLCAEILAAASDDA